MSLREKVGRYYLVFWTTLVFLFSWLPLVRSLLDGDTYEWGTTHFGIFFHGAGLEGDLWFLFVKLAVGFAAVYGISRLWRPGLAIAMALAVAYFGDSLQGYFADPDGMVFRGDTLGIELNVGFLSVLLNAAALLAAGLLLAGWRRLGSHRGLEPTNRRALLALAALLPLQLALLRFGRPHGTTDQIGVILTILQWFAVPWALRLIRTR